MKILSPGDIQDWDKYTILNEPIKSIDLMERASHAFVDSFTTRYDTSTPIIVLAGSGNNGGDGLAIARLLYDNGYQVEVILCSIGPYTPDNRINQDRLPEGVSLHFVRENDTLPESSPSSVLIDGLFGNGLNRPIEGYWSLWVEWANHHRRIVAIDIPSGLMNFPGPIHSAIKATVTYTFQTPKLVFLFPEYEEYVGEWHILDIGLSANFPPLERASLSFQTKDSIRTLLKKRSRFGHKGTYGHALLLAGSVGKMGASILSGKACLRSGVGLLTIESPNCGYKVLQTAIPEAMVSSDRNEYYIADVPEDLNKFSAIGIGPGLDQRRKTVSLLFTILQRSNVPIVLDADALNILATHKEIWDHIPPNTIITPHPGEFDRLFGEHSHSYDRIETAMREAEARKIIIVLKGAYSAIITSDGRCYFNSSGNPGMATAGSGDVLTGIILSLLAQDYAPEVAARIGVFWHGLAGDCAASQSHIVSTIASDIIRCLGVSYAKMSHE